MALADVMQQMRDEIKRLNNRIDEEIRVRREAVHTRELHLREANAKLAERSRELGAANVARDLARSEGQAEISAWLEKALTTPPQPTDVYPDWVYAIRKRLAASGEPWVDMQAHHADSAARRASESD